MIDYELIEKVEGHPFFEGEITDYQEDLDSAIDTIFGIVEGENLKENMNQLHGHFAPMAQRANYGNSRFGLIIASIEKMMQDFHENGMF